MKVKIKQPSQVRIARPKSHNQMHIQKPSRIRKHSKIDYLPVYLASGVVSLIAIIEAIYAKGFLYDAPTEIHFGAIMAPMALTDVWRVLLSQFVSSGLAQGILASGCILIIAHRRYNKHEFCKMFFGSNILYAFLGALFGLVTPVLSVAPGLGIFGVKRVLHIFSNSEYEDDIKKDTVESVALIGISIFIAPNWLNIIVIAVLSVINWVFYRIKKES